MLVSEDLRDVEFSIYLSFFKHPMSNYWVLPIFNLLVAYIVLLNIHLVVGSQVKETTSSATFVVMEAIVRNIFVKWKVNGVGNQPSQSTDLSNQNPFWMLHSYNLLL